MCETANAVSQSETARGSESEELLGNSGRLALQRSFLTGKGTCFGHRQTRTSNRVEDTICETANAVRQSVMVRVSKLEELRWNGGRLACWRLFLTGKGTCYKHRQTRTSKHVGNAICEAADAVRLSIMLRGSELEELRWNGG